VPIQLDDHAPRPRDPKRCDGLCRSVRFGDRLWSGIMRTLIGILGATCLLAGIVISFFPIGPCNHAPWQFACVIVLVPSLLPLSYVFDITDWDFQRHMYLVGALQTLLLVGPFFLGGFTRHSRLARLKRTV
jgi:hypothetical protein